MYITFARFRNGPGFKFTVSYPKYNSNKGTNIEKKTSKRFGESFDVLNVTPLDYITNIYAKRNQIHFKSNGQILYRIAKEYVEYFIAL